MNTANQAEAEAPIEEPETQEETQTPEPRDFETEARRHGWTPKEEFKGDPDKWVDAETFARRADEVMPFLKKQNNALKGEIRDLKKEFRRVSEFYSASEKRQYERALKDLQAKHDIAVESGDVQASREVMSEMEDLRTNAPQPVVVPDDEDDDAPNPQAEFAEWVEKNDWYVTDDKKRAYADIQANALGQADKYPGGRTAWLKELETRVNRKFSGNSAPSPVNGGGNRAAASKGGKTYNDLPPEAKAIADKWDRQGLMKKADYVKNYQWD